MVSLVTVYVCMYNAMHEVPGDASVGYTCTQGSSWVCIHACTKDGNEYMNSRCTKYMHVAMAMGSIDVWNIGELQHS